MDDLTQEPAAEAVAEEPLRYGVRGWKVWDWEGWNWPAWRRAAATVAAITAFAMLLVSLMTLNETIDQNRRQNQLTLQGQVADRFAKAVDQLNSPSQGVRLGAVFALQKIGLDSEDYGTNAAKILIAFVTQSSKHPPACPLQAEPEVEVPKPYNWAYGRSTTPDDIVAAVRAVASLSHSGVQLAVFHPPSPEPTLSVEFNDYLSRGARTGVSWDLPNCWRDIDLSDLNAAHKGSLRGWNIWGADLSFARFEDSDLSFAILDGAKMASAQMNRAVLEGAWLMYAELFGAEFDGAIMRGAHLEGADLCGARFKGAVFAGVHFTGAGFRPASLRGAHLEGADLRGADLTGVDLSESNHDSETKWPEGFAPPPRDEAAKSVNCPPILSW
ncbi:pentapeptide repeat-containing protein [Segniliparus rugosus]|uniref:Pentapeptide repeat-containing protein n=1 Tax=Segniliparus rugosus (strain ATCC BAA-974 / DSM 45345 / CCUG 50838 / CIP 108380 / JCM 13579 / CDC 945) TaxID=679197 RepID=E5XT61_SEGRC|nr:pentapeptide repeat-containing protein [Segniliparus rugosus]EFV12472.2 hypothetical protein HMPREF9336_02683 [Segniliparus rugosus ATCC BAA-974]